MAQEHTIVTPEAVVLGLDSAGLGSRFSALLIDSLLQGVILVVLLAGGVGLRTWGPVVVGGAVVFVPVVYGAVFEGLWNGRSPGKRAVHLRVVQADGQPVAWKHTVVRNLFRLVDLWAGVLFVLLTRRSQRLGDLAAGTVVVREPKGPAPQPLALGSDALRDALVHRIDTTALGPREYAMLRDFIRRRTELDEAGRLSVGRQLADVVRSRVPLPPDERIPDEVMIEAAVVSVQVRQAAAEGERRGPGGGPGE